MNMLTEFMCKPLILWLILSPELASVVIARSGTGSLGRGFMSGWSTSSRLGVRRSLSWGKSAMMGWRQRPRFVGRGSARSDNLKGLSPVSWLRVPPWKLSPPSHMMWSTTSKAVTELNLAWFLLVFQILFAVFLWLTVLSGSHGLWICDRPPSCL